MAKTLAERLSEAKKAVKPTKQKTNAKAEKSTEG
tara:strand:- start:805 stop:906 length:102 start_codon:yes stop_codon:yes gene_type:complete